MTPRLFAGPGESSRAGNLIGRWTQHASALLFVALLVINLVQVVVRALGQGFIWVTDVSQLMLLWMVMLGTVAAYCYNEHIVTGFLDTKLTGVPQRVLLVILRVLEALFFLILVVAGLTVASTRWGIPYVQLGISTGWTYASIPAAGALLLLSAALRPITPPAPDAGLQTILEEEPHDGRH